jgi:hypothetical protein
VDHSDAVLALECGVTNAAQVGANDHQTASEAREGTHTVYSKPVSDPLRGACAIIAAVEAKYPPDAPTAFPLPEPDRNPV